MLGAVAISERPLSDQAVLLDGSETLTANFTKSSASSVLFDASASQNQFQCRFQRRLVLLSV